LADRLSYYAQPRLLDPTGQDAAALALALVSMGTALYLDFSGYTEMARGSAKLFGIELSQNFRWPLSVTNPADFWRRWHLTLTGCSRDYVFEPLSGRPVLALLITAGLVGLWHGAAWRFALWGLVNGSVLGIYALWRIHGPSAERRRRAVLLPALGTAL